MNIQSFIRSAILATFFIFSNQTFANNTTSSSASIIKQPIVAFFGYDPDYCTCSDDENDIIYSPTPIAEGFYRILLGRNDKGYYFVQDFYQENNQAQSSPFWIPETHSLFSFEPSYYEGSTTLFRKNGDIAENFTLEEGILIFGEQFYKNNKKAVVYKFNKNNQYQITMWYDSGKKAAEYTVDEYFEFIKGKAWDQNGKSISDVKSVISQINSDLIDIF
ncbi:hypothetical protein [Acinetobacter equi]|uniref:Uncharacterized protein n=1 Tax=Acinetobacter equi TaxID=1324350 RepID=A0A0N9VXY6_9GAMM|nr:hypothetical protein [Acinetobacter equi]ALH94172.1 hypothetical protein AOY20_00690 [Acinetobacter equi]